MIGRNTFVIHNVSQTSGGVAQPTRHSTIQINVDLSTGGVP